MTPQEMARWYRRSLLKLLAGRPMTAVEAAALTGKVAKTTRNHLRVLHEQGLVHIADWAMPWSVHVAVYAAGPGVDAQRPADAQSARSPKASTEDRHAAERAALLERVTLKPHRSELDRYFFGPPPTGNRIEQHTTRPA